MLDLQIHTTDSDGTWPWDKALEHCVKIGLKAFAITDHDTIVRCNEVRAWGQERGVQAIPGIELSTKHKGQTVHLLGYFLDGSTEKLEKRLDFLREARHDRNKKIILKLQSLGHDVSEEGVKKISGEGTMGRPHIARLLLEKGIVRSIREAFDRYLSIDGSAYFPKEEVPLREGIELLHASGAVTSVAHPMLLKRSPQDLEASFQEWKSWGLDGLEAIYPTYNPEQTAFVRRMTRKYDFLTTGGSDFHGENKPYIKIGTGTGQLHVPDELLEPLLKRREEINGEIRSIK